MRMPWANKTGLAKAATILVTICILSVGLCGINFFAVTSTQTMPATFLIVTAYLELAAILLSLAGLLVLGLIAIGKEIKENFFRSPDKDNTD